MRRPYLLLALFLFFLTVPLMARADMGTPLMLAEALHLIFLNALIGLLEGSILAKWFHLPKWRTNVAMVPANYISMIVGALLLYNAWTPLERLLPGAAPLYKAGTLLFLLLVGSWILTIVLEWPFCAWAMRKTDSPSGKSLWLRSLQASLIAQTTSYALLVPFYLLVSPITLYTSGRIEHSLAFVRPPVATVYYINPDDGAVWRIRSDGTGKQKALEAHLLNQDARLYVSPDEESGTCAIGVVERKAGDIDNTKQTLLPDVGTGCSSSPHDGNRPANTGFNFGLPADLRPESKQEWKARTGFWAVEGIHINHRISPLSASVDQEYGLAFETPFEQWPCRSATVLPNNQVVFQLGLDKANSQIVILDMASRQLGFLTMGQGPVVVMKPK